MELNYLLLINTVKFDVNTKVFHWATTRTLNRIRSIEWTLLNANNHANNQTLTLIVLH